MPRSQFLGRLPSPVLSAIASHCGVAHAASKATKVQGIQSGLQVLDRPRVRDGPFPILAVDVGIKNFSYCKTVLALAGDPQPPRLSLLSWRHLDLEAIYPFQVNTLTDEKHALAHWAHELVHDVFVDPLPAIVTIENQRTRSSGGAKGLPRVLLNSALEHSLHASFHTYRQVAGLPEVLVTPSSAKSMVHFWINRFLDQKQTRFTPLRTKKLRLHLVLHLFNTKHLHIDDIDLSGTIPQQAKRLLQAFSEHSPYPVKKLDDVVDSLLYNLMIQRSLYARHSLRETIDTDGDILAWIKRQNEFHFSLVQGLFEANDVVPDPAYAHE